MRYKSVSFEKFDSIGSLLTTINSRPNNSEMLRENSSQRNGRSGLEFTKTNSYEEATELLIKGWTEKLDEIKSSYITAVKTNSNGAIDRRRTYNHVVGYAPNVPNALLGLPQSMIASKTEPQKVKTVSIVYAATGLGDVSTTSYIKAGIVVLNIINRLEMNGIRVSLNVLIKDSVEYNNYAGCMVTVKGYRDQLDLQKVAFPIAHPAMMRRFGFKWIETYPELKGHHGQYGGTVSEEEGHKEFLTEIGAMRETDYYLCRQGIEDLKYDIEQVIKAAGIKL